MFGSAALDVAIGLVLVFLLFSLVVSKINETATSLLSTRHAGLRKGLEALLGDGSDNSVLSADTVLGHALVTPIQAAAKSNLGTRVRNMFGRAQGISYLPGRTFSAAVLDLLAPAAAADPGGPAVAPGDPMQRALDAVSGLSPTNPARAPLMRMLADAQGDRERFRQTLEHWFDDTMDRVSGWYKRYVQRVILVVSIVLVASLNVDAVNIAQVLWRVPTERAAVATAAAAHVTAGRNPGQTADQQVQAITALKLPIGWTPPHAAAAPSIDPRHAPIGVAAWLIKLLGLALTVLALSLGAPFWFDALSKLGSLRQSGPKPTTTAHP